MVDVAPFVLKTAEEFCQYLIGQFEDLDLTVTELLELGVELREGQAELLKAAAAIRQGVQDIDATLASRPEDRVVRYVRTDFGPDGTRRALDALGHADPYVLEHIRDAVGDPADAKRVVNVIAERPSWLRGGPIEGPIALATMAQQLAEWTAASDAWQDATLYAADATRRADLLVRSAVAAQIARLDIRYQPRLQDARDLDPNCPRLRLEEISNLIDPAAQIALLNQLSTADDELLALIHLQLALAHLLTPDCAAARHHLQIAEKHAPYLLQLPMVAMNIDIQDARVAISLDQSVNVTALSQALTDAQSMRRTLQDLKRFEESGRTLMLACDAAAMLGRLEHAKELLGAATPEELAAGRNVEVLADIALRLSEYRRALEILEGYPETEGIRRQRAYAITQTGTSDAVDDALATLREIALGGGAEALFAATNRCMCCVTKPYLAWDDDVAKYLIDSGHARIGVGARAFQLARLKRFEQANALLEPYAHELWALEGLMRVAVRRNNRNELLSAIDRLLRAGPDLATVSTCGSLLVNLEEYEDAIPVLTRITRQPGAANVWRSEAFHSLLIAIVNHENDWPRAYALWKDWRGLDPRDRRIEGWYARMLTHGVTGEDEAG